MSGYSRNVEVNKSSAWWRGKCIGGLVVCSSKEKALPAPSIMGGDSVILWLLSDSLRIGFGKPQLLGQVFVFETKVLLNYS